MGGEQTFAYGLLLLATAFSATDEDLLLNRALTIPVPQMWCSVERFIKDKQKRLA